KELPSEGPPGGGPFHLSTRRGPSLPSVLCSSLLVLRSATCLCCLLSVVCCPLSVVCFPLPLLLELPPPPPPSLGVCILLHRDQRQPKHSPPCLQRRRLRVLHPRVVHRAHCRLERVSDRP